MQLTLQGDLQEVVHILGHVELGLLQAGDGPAIVEVSLVDSNRQTVVDEMSSCGEVQVPLEGLQQQQLHVEQTLLGQDQVHGAHASQAVQGLQFGHPVLPLLKFTCTKRQKHLNGPEGEEQPAGPWVRRELTGQEETRERDNVKLLHCDVVAVHEQVQQVDGQVSGCRTQPEVVADDGHQVGKVPSQAELRGLSFVRRQLELLQEQAFRLRLQRTKSSSSFI